jgi:PhzF family phenazine biosynthesis protein
MGVTIYQVDAFTDKPYKGNPAAVCLLEETREDAWMQAVANENNLSETAFLGTGK